MKGKAFLVLSVVLVATVSASLPAGAVLPAPHVGVVNYGYDQVAGSWRVNQHPRLLADVKGDSKADLNNDGRADIVGFYGNGTYVSLGRPDGKFTAATLGVASFGYSTSAGGWRVERHPRLLGDVNGDKFADIVGFSEKGTVVALGKGDGTFMAATMVLPAFGYDANAGGWRVEQHPRLLGDVNGDGRADVVGFGAAGTYVAVGKFDGTFGPATLAVAGFGYNTNVGGWRVERHPRLLGDVNGDKRADIVGFSEKGTVVSLGKSNGTFTATPQAFLPAFGYNDNVGAWRVDRHPRLLGDVNGDKRADVVGFGGNGTYVALGKANGTLGAATLGIANFGYETSAGGWRVERHPRLLGDVNGDNKADVVAFSEQGTNISLGKLDGTFAATTFEVAAFGYNDNVGGWRVERNPRLLGDVNGGGKADIVGFGNAATYVSLSS